MTEEIINGIDIAGCDFYNEKICALFSKYFGFNVECENVFLSTIDCDIERECPIKRLEAENEKLKEILKSVRGYFIVLENIIPTEMLAEGSGVFGAINDAKKEIGEVLKKKMNEEIDVSRCEFQSDCIEYKDISYLKVMPICAIHELSIACHDKVNKCKYYTLYTQLKRSEAENAKLKEEINKVRQLLNEYCMDCDIDEYSNTYEKCDDCIATDIGKIIGERAEDDRN